MKLLGALTSPYVRKVRIVMAEKKLDYQLVLEDVWASDAILDGQSARQGALPGDGRAARRCSTRASSSSTSTRCRRSGA
jgi:hypothetical protein